MKLSKDQTFSAPGIPVIVKMKVKRIIERYYNKKTGHDEYEEKYVPDKSSGPYFEKSPLSTSPIIRFDTNDMEFVHGIGELEIPASAQKDMDSTTFSEEEKKNWKLGFTGLSIGEKDDKKDSILDLSFESERTKTFSIKYEWPVGHKYFLWRKQGEKPLAFVCTESFDPKEIP